MKNSVEKELKILDKYRELFYHICSSDMSLEYSGTELYEYYKKIEGIQEPRPSHLDTKMHNPTPQEIEDFWNNK